MFLRVYLSKLNGSVKRLGWKLGNNYFIIIWNETSYKKLIDAKGLFSHGDCKLPYKEIGSCHCSARFAWRQHKQRRKKSLFLSFPVYSGLSTASARRHPFVCPCDFSKTYTLGPVGGLFPYENLVMLKQGSVCCKVGGGGWGVRGELLMERQKHGPDRRDAQTERWEFEALFFKKQMTTRRIKRRQRLLYSEILFNLDFFSLWQKISD